MAVDGWAGGTATSLADTLTTEEVKNEADLGETKVNGRSVNEWFTQLALQQTLRQLLGTGSRVATGSMFENGTTMSLAIPSELTILTNASSPHAIAAFLGDPREPTRTISPHHIPSP